MPALEGAGMRERVLITGQPQIKEQSRHMAVCPLVWARPGIGPLGQHPGKGIDLCLILF